MEWYKSLHPKFTQPQPDKYLYFFPCIDGLHFNDLPKDIFYLIILYLDYKDIKIFYQVSKLLSPLNNNFWANKIYHDFGITEVSTISKDLVSRYIQISIDHNIPIAGGEKYVSSYRNAVVLAYQAAKKGDSVSRCNRWLATVDHLIIDNIQLDINNLVIDLGQIIYKMNQGSYKWPGGYSETCLNAAYIIVGKAPIFSYSDTDAVYDSYNIAAAITGNLRLPSSCVRHRVLIYSLAFLFKNMSLIYYMENEISSDLKDYLTRLCESWI